MEEIRPALDANLKEAFPGGMLKWRWEGDVMHLSGPGAKATIALQEGPPRRPRRARSAGEPHAPGDRAEDLAGDEKGRGLSAMPMVATPHPGFTPRATRLYPSGHATTQPKPLQESTPFPARRGERLALAVSRDRR